MTQPDPADPGDPVGPCGNEDCDKCYPIPHFVVSTERVARLRHVRTIKAATAEEALRIYREGTAWPSSYDDRELAILEQSDTVVALAEPSFLAADEFCFHKLRESAEFKLFQSAGDGSPHEES